MVVEAARDLNDSDLSLGKVLAMRDRAKCAGAEKGWGARTFATATEFSLGGKQSWLLDAIPSFSTGLYYIQ